MSRLFDLIESKSFEELNAEEKSFVLSQISEAEYQSQRMVLASTQELNYKEVQPLPLVMPKTEKRTVPRTIPLYQALIGAACLTIGFFLLGNGKSHAVELKFFENPIQFTFTNAPSEIQFIHDTVIEKLELRSPVKVLRDTITLVQTVFVQTNDTRMLEAGNSLNRIPLDKNLLESKSLSAKEDGSVALLPKMKDYGSMR